MDLKLLLTVGGTVFLAELGDKTQLMTIGLVSRTRAPWSVFLGSSLALCAVTAIGVLAGELLTRYVPEGYIQKAAALLFIGIGIVMLIKK